MSLMKTNSIKRNFIYNSLYQLLVIAIPLITTPYVSRVLGPEGIGEYSYRYSIAYYYMIFILLGLNNYGNRTIAQSRDDKDKLEKSFWSIYIMQLLIGVIVNLTYLIYSLFLSSNKKISLIMSLYVLSSALDINWFFFGMEKFKMSVTRNFCIKILSTISIFLFVKSPSDVGLYCLILAGSTFVSQCVLWPYIIKNIKIPKLQMKDIIVHIKPNLFLFLTVIAVSLFKIMDKIMLGIMTEKSEVGFYESSEKIISVPTALITSLGTVMLPHMSNKVEKKNDEKNRSTIYYSILFAMFMSSSLCFGIMGVAKEFVPLFYGEGFEKCILLFWILLPSCLFLAFANVIRTQYLLPHQMDTQYVVSAFCGAVVNILVNLCLIPHYGAIGAAIGTLFAEIVVCIYQTYQVKQYLPIVNYVKKSVVFVIAGGIMFLSLIYLNPDLGSNTRDMIGKIIIGTCIYFIILGIELLIYRLIFHKKFITYEN